MHQWRQDNAIRLLIALAHVTLAVTAVRDAKPTLSKAFTPAQVGVTQPAQLTFILTNSPTNPAQSGLDFSDNLPSGLELATPMA